MIFRRRLGFVALLLFTTRMAEATAADPLARIDQLHARRDDPRAQQELKQLIEAELTRTPDNVDLLWRSARECFWEGDDPALSKEVRSRVGKMGWDRAERAVALRPQDPTPHYWAALTIGVYSAGVGMLSALSQGIEGKFKNHLQRGATSSPSREHGNVETTWGRFYAKLPWPKRDLKQAEEHYRRALAINPANLRAKVYLAELLADDKRRTEAVALANEVMASPANRYDPPDEKRAQAAAARFLKSTRP